MLSGMIAHRKRGQIHFISFGVTEPLHGAGWHYLIDCGFGGLCH